MSRTALSPRSVALLTSAALGLALVGCGPATKRDTAPTEVATANNVTATAAGSVTESATTRSEDSVAVQVTTKTPDSTQNGIDSLNLPDEYRKPFARLNDEGRAALVALHREGSDDVLRQALEKAELELLWRNANSYVVKPDSATDTAYSQVLTWAYVESRPGVKEEQDSFAQCVKKYGLAGTSPDDLINRYRFRGAPGVPYEATEDQIAILDERANDASEKCGDFSGSAAGIAQQNLGIAASDLRRELRLPPKPEEETATIIDQGSQIPTCRKDKNGVVYHGGLPEKPVTGGLRDAGLTADVPKLTALLKTKPQEFNKPHHVWILPMLARTGCVEALDVVLKSKMPVLAPDIFDGKTKNWQNGVMRDVGRFATPETFDRILTQAVAQNAKKQPVVNAIEEGMCHYPKGFAAVLAKHAFTGLDVVNASEGTTYPLWQRATRCGEPEFAQAFIGSLGEKIPAGALAQVVQDVCPKPASMETSDHQAATTRAVKLIKLLRQLGYKPEDVGSVTDRESNTTDTSATQIVKDHSCQGPVKEALTP